MKEKIIEIAERYGRLENIYHGLVWYISEDGLLDFAKALIEAAQAEKSNSNTMSIDGSLSKIGTKSDIKFNSNGNERMSIDGHLRPLGTESPTTKLTVNTGDLPAGIFSANDIGPKSFSFRPQNSTEILRLDKEGMTFMGERITDAGEAYDAWMKAMAMIQGGRK